jgi:signal transduction histidine kinase
MESSFYTSQIVVFVIIGIVFMLLMALVVVLLSNRAEKQIFRQRMDNQELQLKHQQELLERNLLVQEEERQTIAAQLHDDIGSKLGVLHLTFHRLRRMEAMTEQYNLMCEEIDGLIDNTLDASRRISHGLLPPTLEDFGLLEALNEFCEGVRHTGVLDIQFEYNVVRADLPDPLVELNLFRIIQELTNNSLKYSKATNITIQLMKYEERKALRYRDNGQGFDLENTVSKGLGLKNLENRVRMINGNSQINTALGKGFEAFITF